MLRWVGPSSSLRTARRADVPRFQPRRGARRKVRGAPARAAGRRRGSRRKRRSVRRERTGASRRPKRATLRPPGTPRKMKRASVAASDARSGSSRRARCVAPRSHHENTALTKASARQEWRACCVHRGSKPDAGLFALQMNIGTNVELVEVGGGGHRKPPTKRANAAHRESDDAYVGLAVARIDGKARVHQRPEQRFWNFPMKKEQVFP